MTARLDNTAFNIQQGHPTTWAADSSSHSIFSSPIDNESTPSECDYAECVVALNNIEVEVSLTSPSSNIPSYNFLLSPSQSSRTSNEETLNSMPNGDTNTSMEPFPPTVIPYSTNVPADPSLWDGNFTVTFLFGTNKFLHSNVHNMACLLQCMACFLKQRSLTGRNGNNIVQLELFREFAWDFILAIFEAGWDQLYSSDSTSIRNKVKTHLGNLKDQGIKSYNNSTPMRATNRRVLPPIPPCLTRKQMEKSKIHGKTAQSPTYAQAANSSVNILKIKETFPALPNKKIIEIHSVAFSNPGPNPINYQGSIL